MKEIKLKVRGMHCHSCETLIKEDLEEIRGVKKAEADHQKSFVRIESEDNVNVEKIKAKIKELGYEVSEDVEKK